MAIVFYSKVLPDYMNRDAPGYRVNIRENDGRLGLEMMHASQNLTTGTGFSVLLNVDEAKEMLKGLQEAIDEARSKGGHHRP